MATDSKLAVKLYSVTCTKTGAGYAVTLDFDKPIPATVHQLNVYLIPLLQYHFSLYAVGIRTVKMAKRYLYKICAQLLQLELLQVGGVRSIHESINKTVINEAVKADLLQQLDKVQNQWIKQNAIMRS